MANKERQTIQMTTYQKIKDFLTMQSEPVYKSLIVRAIGVDYNSLNVALKMLCIKTDKEGRVELI